MFIKKTGGAYTFANDYVLYRVDPIKKSLVEHQTIFKFAHDMDEENVYGAAVLLFLDDTDDQIEITETLDHSDDRKRKGTFVVKYQFDNASMRYKKME